MQASVWSYREKHWCEAQLPQQDGHSNGLICATCLSMHKISVVGQNLCAASIASVDLAVQRKAALPCRMDSQRASYSNLCEHAQATMRSCHCKLSFDRTEKSVGVRHIFPCRMATQMASLKCPAGCGTSWWSRSSSMRSFPRIFLSAMCFLWTPS